VRRVLLAVLLAGLAVPCAAARDPLQVIDDCMARLDTSLDVGYAHIAQRCPELAAALTQSPLAAWLPRDWNRPDNQLSAQGLSELRVLLVRAGELRPARGILPATQHVAGILAAISLPQPSQLSWWTRFKQWLRRIMSAPSQADESWFTRWWQSIKLSGNSRDLITGICLAVLVVLAVGVIVNELRVAGLLGRRSAAGTAVPRGPAARGQVTLGQIETVAPRERPALLLELIAAQLAVRGLLPPARTLTARELVRRARLPDSAGRANLVQLVAVCERIRFAAEDVEEEIRENALRAGRLLLSAIDTLPVSAVQV
jgi:Domain of unknown function (DUF4129)